MQQLPAIRSWILPALVVAALFGCSQQAVHAEGYGGPPGDPPPIITWDDEPAINGGTIGASASNVKAGGNLAVTLTGAEDLDTKTTNSVPSYHNDTIHYSWTSVDAGNSPAGTFVGSGTAPTWRAPSTPGVYTLRCFVYDRNTGVRNDPDGAAATAFTVTVVGIEKIQYKNGAGTWVDVPSPLTVHVGTEVEFKAIASPSGASWPASTPFWVRNGPSANGTDAMPKITFGTVGTKTLKFTCGTSKVSTTIIVYSVTLKVRPKKASNAGTFGSTASVCAGGINSNAHIAQVQVSTNPVAPGATIVTTKSGGAGAFTSSVLSIGSTADSNGKIDGELISSDKIQSASLTANGATATVSFDWNIDWTSTSWDSNPDYIAPTSTETVHITHHGEPVNGHVVRFLVEEITYVDSSGDSITTFEPSEVSPYASFSPIDVTTNAGGMASSTLTTTTAVNVISEKLRLYDRSVIEGVAGPSLDGTPVSSNPTRLAQLAGEYDFRSDGTMTVMFTPATATTVAEGTAPYTGAKVLPGQNMAFKLEIRDLDEYRATGGLWKTFAAPGNFLGGYEIELTLVNAKFTDLAGTQNGGTKKVFDAVRIFTDPKLMSGRFGLFNVGITVDSTWNGTAPVLVNIKVTDRIKIPDNIVLSAGTNSNSLQDNTPPWTGSISWVKALATPDTVTPIWQEPGKGDGEDGVGTLQNQTAFDSGIGVMNLCGPDTNGGANAAANYQGVTVNEVFGTRTSNLLRSWLSTGFLAGMAGAMPETGAWGDAEWVSYFFAGTGSSNSTFVVSANDTFSDAHTGVIFAFMFIQNINPHNILSAAGKAETIWVDLPQTYTTQDPTTYAVKDLGQFRIRRQKTPTLYQIQKTTPP